MSFDTFADRHIGVSNPDELKAMLDTIGVGSVDELIAQVIPQSIRLKKPLDLPAGMSEYEFAAHIRALADRNPQQFVDIYRCAASDFIPCDVRIYHDRRRPSRLEVLRLR